MTRPRVGSLTILHERLRRLHARTRGRLYRLPAIWNCWGYSDVERIGQAEIKVNPVRFLLACLDDVVLPGYDRGQAGRSLSRIRGVRPAGQNTVIDGRVRRRGGDWIREASIYGTLVRTTTAWDHDGDGRLGAGRWTETGTFVKSILLLPLLARIGVNTLYLLPVAKCSRLFRKGELGCPYSAKSFLELEPDLHDRLLGPSPADVDLEFGAFVESAHALGMRVMLDLCPRTAARDSDLILDHPDWFYWIDARAAGQYGPPHIDGFTDSIPRPSQLPDLFSRQVLRTHLARFRHWPGLTDPVKWRRFVKRCRANPPANLVTALAREFGVIPPPGFSDCINDPQPPWTDVTFLRLFLDHPRASAKLLDDPAGQPPYVLTDTIKASKFPGRRPNKPLWRLLAGILPHYQRFGIDGARVDMGHALPPQLQQMIIDKPRRTDPDFCFLAEEFNHAAAAGARRAGFNAIIGSSWYLEPRAGDGELHRLAHDVLPGSSLPCWAAAETPDTPRSTTRRGGRAFSRAVAVLNHFLPSALPFINSGLEVFERQPMNLGLDLQPPGRFALPRSDPYYGKLAYFDRVALHWGNRGGRALVDLLGRAAAVRQRFLADLTWPGNFFAPRVVVNARSILALGWRVGRERRALIVAANLDFGRRRRCCIEALPAAVRRRRQAELLLEIHPSPGRVRLATGSLRLILEPGDVKVLLL